MNIDVRALEYFTVIAVLKTCVDPKSKKKNANKSVYKTETRIVLTL